MDRQEAEERTTCSQAVVAGEACSRAVGAGETCSRAVVAGEACSRAVGAMEMPAHFPYRAIYLHGRPRHEKYDDFWRMHPPMNPEHRAKIFSAFDALAGFGDAIASASLAAARDDDTRIPFEEIAAGQDDTIP